ncbi:MAG: TRAP transporter substrate-binding protein [Gammaproteobacteria bacterium]
MKLNRLCKPMFAIAAALGFVFAAPYPAVAQQPRVKWSLQSAFGTQTPHLGVSALRFVKTIGRLSAGRFEIKIFEPGAIVPALECFDAAAKGSVEACWTTSGFHSGKFPAAAFFGTVPFGPQLGEFLAWKWFGGGNELRAEVYGQQGVIAFDSICTGPETSGWFRKEINTPDDLKGLKMRFFGLGAKVMQKLGVSTQLLAPGDIFPALERGVIDATEFSMPTMDIKMGFQQIAKFDYFPGWHQQISCGELLMNKAAYDALPDEYKAMLEAATGQELIYTYAETEALNPPALTELTAKYGVNVRRWSDDFLKLYEEKWREVLQEESAKDPLFKKVADSYLKFREQYRIWGDAQAIRPTYLK